MSVTKISDTFTDADNTALASHTPNVGGSWSNSKGTHKILSNKATPNSGVDDDMAVIDAGVSDGILTVDVVPRNLTINEYDPDIIVRYTDTTHLWVIHVSSAGSGVIQLYENTGSGYVQRATATPGWVSGSTNTIKINLSGASITVYGNGTLLLTYNSATSNQTATKIGIRTGQAGSTTLCTWDNFLFQTVTGDAAGAATVAGAGIGGVTAASSGAATVAGIGAATAAGVGASSGSATVAGVGASIAAAAGSASGQATVSGVGASIDGDNVIAAAAGSATVSGVGNSIAAAAGSAGGQATVGGAGASIVAAVGEADGIATCNASGVAQIGGTTDPYRPARVDDDQDTRKRQDEGQDVRARYDDSQDTRKRVDEAA